MALCGVGLAWASMTGAALPLVYLLLLGTGSFRALGWPASTTIVTGLVPPKIFPNAAMWRSVVFQLAATLGPLAGVPLLLITHKGARTGKIRTNPLGYYDDVGTPVLFASGMGSPAHPQWVHNLRANPNVAVELLGEAFSATAREVEGAEREALWARVIEEKPFLVEHQAKFISSVTGGPAYISDDLLEEVHEHLDIDPAAFDEMVGLMGQSLSIFGIGEDDREQVLEALRARKRYIVATGSG